MNWLSKIFGCVAIQKRSGITLRENVDWEVSPVESVSSFLRALIDLVPTDSVLYLEGSSTPPKIESFLEDHKSGRVTKVEVGTIWPSPKCFHVVVSSETLEGLAQLTGDVCPPELATHVHVYKDNKILLEWYDAFDSPLYLSKEIPEEKVKKFCNNLGVDYRKIKINQR